MQVLLVTQAGLSVTEASSTTAAVFSNLSKIPSGSKVTAYPAIVESTEIIDILPSATGMTFICMFADKQITVEFDYEDMPYTLHNKHATVNNGRSTKSKVSLQLIAKDGSTTPYAELFRHSPLTQTH